MSMRIKVNPKTGKAVLAGIPVGMLTQILTSSALHQYDTLKKVKGGQMPPQITDAEEYAENMLRLIRHLENTLPRWRRTTPLTKAERFAAVREQKELRDKINAMFRR